MTIQRIPYAAGGVIDNSAGAPNSTVQRFQRYIGAGGSNPLRAGWPQAVTLTIGNPTLVNWTAHGQTQCNPFMFAVSAGGALPAGIDTNTVYYVIAGAPGTAGALTPNQFAFSTRQQMPMYAGDGPPVVTSGALTGTASVILLNQDWIDLEFPPGLYNVGQLTGPTTGAICKKVRIHGHGASFNNLNFNTSPSTTVSFGRGNFNVAYVNQPTSAANGNIKAGTGIVAGQGLTLITPSDVSKFNVNGWCVIYALDMQVFGFPPNAHYHEYIQIKSINVSGGTYEILLWEPLKNGYKTTFPLYQPGADIYPSNGGPATLMQMNEAWNTQVYLFGMRSTAPSTQSVCQSRHVVVKDCYYDGQGMIPSWSDTVVFDNCNWLSGRIAIDKLINNFVIINCNVPQAGVQNEGGALDRLSIRDSTLGNLTGTARITEVINCDIATVILGPQAFGYTETFYAENCRFPTLTAPLPTDFANANQLSLWTFSNGVLSRPHATKNIPWAVPGRKMFISDFAGAHSNMGSPFTVLDIYADAGSCAPFTSGTYDNTTGNVSLTMAAPLSYMAPGLLVRICQLSMTGTGNVNSLSDSPATTTAGSTGSTVNFTLAPGLQGGGAPITITGGQLLSGNDYITTTLPVDFLSALGQAPSTLKLCPHVASNVTLRNTTGGALTVDTCMAADGLPIYSYAKRTLTGNYNTNAAFSSKPLVWGNLVFLNINVIRAYSGAGTLTLNISTNTFVAKTLALVTVALAVDLTAVGLRKITASTVTGALSGDTLPGATTGIPNWFGDPINMVFAGTGSPVDIASAPIVEVEISTDQGETRWRQIEWANVAIHEPHTQLLSDSATPAIT